MKILYIGNFILPDGNAAAHRVIGNAKALRAAGHDVVLLGCKINEGRSLFESRETYNNFIGYTFRKPDKSLNWLNYLCNIDYIKAIIKEEKPSAIIIYNYPAIAGERLRRYCQKHSIYIFADCTEWFEPEGSFFYKNIKKWDTEYRMRVLHPKLDGIISISSFLENYYKDLGCKTICIPPLIDKEDEKWASNESSVSDDHISFIYVGNPGAGKKDMLNISIACLRKIKEKGIPVVFNIVGITKIQYEVNFGKLDVDDEEWLHFLGKLQNVKALSLIKNSDFSIFFRKKNLVTTAGFPTKLSESIACGTPVITNDSSDLKEYIENGKNGFLVEIDDMDYLFEQILVICNLSKSQLFGMKEYCAQEKTFDYREYIEKIRVLFPK